MNQIIKHINISSAKVKLKTNKKVVLLDIRDKESFISGHIDGALNVSDSNFREIVNKTSKDREVIVYCYHGNSSQGVAELLVNYGFLDVYSLDGGYEEWKIS